MVIDGLGGPGDSDVHDPWAPFNQRAIADARVSGITACNVTLGVGGNPWDDVIRSIAWREGEIPAHPDVFLKITRGAHLPDANAQGKMGLIYGVQGLSFIGEDLDRLDTLHGLGLRIASSPTTCARSPATAASRKAMRGSHASGAA